MTPQEKRIAADLLKEIADTASEPRYRAAALAEYQTFLTTCLIAQILAGKPPKNTQITLNLPTP
jgi:hypothetical protein